MALLSCFPHPLSPSNPFSHIFFSSPPTIVWQFEKSLKFAAYLTSKSSESGPALSHPRQNPTGGHRKDVPPTAIRSRSFVRPRSAMAVISTRLYIQAPGVFLSLSKSETMTAAMMTIAAAAGDAFSPYIQRVLWLWCKSKRERENELLHTPFLVAKLSEW